MSLELISNKVDELGNAWEQFKAANDERLCQLEAKGCVDTETEEKLQRINDLIDNHKNRLDEMEVVVNRPDVDGAVVGHKDAHSVALCNYLRKGVESELSNLESKALSVRSDVDGGYLVTPHMSDYIAKTIYETSAMRQVARVETISTDSLDIVEDIDEAASGWTSETDTVSDTATPKIGKRSITVHEVYAQPKATQKLIDDANVNIEQWLAEKVADTIARAENASFIHGDGVGKPKGILSYPNGTSWGQIEQLDSGLAGAADADLLFDLYYSLKTPYAQNAVFMMNRTMVQHIRKLKDNNDQYLWQPGLAAGQPDRLLGVPVLEAADMPLPAADSLSIAVGDFKRAYTIVDRMGIRVLRDPFTDKPFVKFYTTKRVGGEVVNFEAVKLMRLAG